MNLKVFSFLFIMIISTSNLCAKCNPGYDKDMVDCIKLECLRIQKVKWETKPWESDQKLNAKLEAYFEILSFIMDYYEIDELE